MWAGRVEVWVVGVRLSLGDYGDNKTVEDFRGLPKNAELE